MSSSSGSGTLGLGSRKEYVLFPFLVSIRLFHRATIRSGSGSVDPDIALRTTIRSFLFGFVLLQ